MSKSYLSKAHSNMSRVRDREEGYVSDRARKIEAGIQQDRINRQDIREDVFKKLLKSFFIKQFVIDLMLNNEENITKQTLNEKMDIVYNNAKFLNSLENKFNEFLNSESKKNAFLYQNETKYQTKESEKLKSSRLLFKETFLSEKAFENTLNDAMSIWSKKQELSWSELENMFSGHIKNMMNDQNFMDSLDEVFSEKMMNKIRNKDNKKQNKI